MVYFQNVCFAVSMILLSFCYNVFPAPSSKVKSVNSLLMDNSTVDTENTTLTNGNSTEGDAKFRSKRQASSGAGKFANAAKSPQIKVLRTVLQMFTNMRSSAPIGGPHPFHPETVKPIIKLYKEKLVNYFFPSVGESKVK